MAIVRCALPAAFAGVAVFATGCSSMSLARSDGNQFQITQVNQQRRPSLFGSISSYGFSQVGPVVSPHTMPRRPSLFGETAFGSNNSGPRSFGPEDKSSSSFTFQKGPGLFEVQEHPFGDPAARSAHAKRSSGLTSERMMAVAKLFEAQGRTEQALRIYQQIEQQNGSGGETPAAEMAAATPHVPSSPNPSQTATEAAPQVLSTPVVPARPIEESMTALSVPSQGLGPSDSNAAPAASLAESNAGNPPENSESSSSGWRVSPHALAKSGDSAMVTVSSATEATPSAPAASTSSWESSKSSPVSAASSVSFDEKDAMFELPANMPRPGKWEKSLDIQPGKFLKPTIRPAASPPAPKVAQPAPVDTPEQLPKSEAEVKATAKAAETAAREVAEEAEPDPSGILIIPNGSKLESRIPATRPAKNSTNDSAPPAKVRIIGDANTEYEAPLALLSGSLREIHSPTVLALATQLASPDPKTRSESAVQLGQVGPEARTVLPMLRDVLKAETDKVARLRIAEAIVKIAPDDADATNVLIESLQDPSDWRYRQFAASALAATANGTESRAVPRLSEALTDSHPRVRSMVALSLAAFGERAKEAVPRLEFARANDLPRVKESAAAALARIKGAATEVAAEPAPLPEEPLSLLPPRELEETAGAAFIGDPETDTIDPADAEAPAEFPSFTE